MNYVELTALFVMPLFIFLGAILKLQHLLFFSSIYHWSVRFTTADPEALPYIASISIVSCIYRVRQHSLSDELKVYASCYHPNIRARASFVLPGASSILPLIYCLQLDTLSHHRAWCRCHMRAIHMVRCVNNCEILLNAKGINNRVHGHSSSRRLNLLDI